MNAEIGTIRETFFISMLLGGHIVHYVGKGDFLIDEKFTFEIGGKNKSFKQIKDIPHSFLALDDMEIGTESKIPLWLFRFLY